MDNRILNKQIPLKSIIDVANYFEDYKDEYIRKFEIDEKKNQNIPYGEKVWEYENGSAEIKYTIEFNNGKTITESDYNWFVGNTNNPKAIKYIGIDLRVSYYANSLKTGNEFYSISSEVQFRDCGMNLNYSDAIVSVDTRNKEQEAHNIYSELINILENNEDRYNKTIKHKDIRMQSFTISVGIILSYILFIVLKLNSNELSKIIIELLDNKYILIFGQWFVSILLGNIFAYWYILALYKPLLPEKRYVGYNTSTNKSIYTDNVSEYTEHSEIHFGKFWDAEIRRNRIEKIYKITSKIVLVQLLISLILFFVLI